MIKKLMISRLFYFAYFLQNVCILMPKGNNMREMKDNNKKVEGLIQEKY